MRVSPVFYDRLFGVGQQLPINWTVGPYSKNVIGGPIAADLVGYGDITALWQCADLLRCPVELWDDEARCVWWGFVEEVELTTGPYTFGLSLASMTNRVRVDYGRIDPLNPTAQTRATTLWNGDTESISTYGVKEQALSMQTATDDQANLTRDAALGRTSAPIPTISVAASDKTKITLRCRGWWDVLSWRLFQRNTLTLGALTTTGTTTQGRIQPGVSLRAGTSFVAPSWAISAATFVVQKIGQPTGNLRCEIWTKDSERFIPGSLVASADLPLSLLPDDKPAPAATTDNPTPDDPPPGDPQTLTWFFSALPLTPGATYFVLLSMDGGTFASADAINITFATTDTGADWTGVYYKPDVGWSLTGGAPDVLFQLGGLSETTTLLSSILMEYGQFLQAVRIDGASGVYATEEGDGDKTAKDRVEELLTMGSTQTLRLIANVTAQRVVELQSEPQRENARFYRLSSYGTLLDPNDVPVPLHTCPAGIWIDLTDIIPHAITSGSLAEIGQVFIESAEYDPSADRWTPTARGIPNVFALGS